MSHKQPDNEWSAQIWIKRNQRREGCFTAINFPVFVCKSPACAHTRSQANTPFSFVWYHSSTAASFLVEGLNWGSRFMTAKIDSKDAIYFLFFSNDRLHLASKIHLWGTFPIMASKWRKMKSQNDRLGRDYFWCSVPYRAITCFLRPFSSFSRGWSLSLPYKKKKKKSPKRLPHVENGWFIFSDQRKTPKSLQPRLQSGS